MPKHHLSTTKLRGKFRTKVSMRRGEIISLCRCWHSSNFPLCDSSHQNLDDEKGPVIITIDCENDFLQKDSD